MKIRMGLELAIASVALTLFNACLTPALAQPIPEAFRNVVVALRTWPGCLGVETGRTDSGRRVIFAWFENKKALVDWYYGEPHKMAQQAVFGDLKFDRKPLPDLPEESGPILAIVSVAFADTPRPNTITSIGVELYGPLPGGVAVGGRFAPDAVKVRGLREIQLGTAQPR